MPRVRNGVLTVKRNREPIAIRNESRAFEEALPPSQRKSLGQFFSGQPLGRILAHLAIDRQTKSVLDPMAGSGDLLDATAEAAAYFGYNLARVDAIEIDKPTTALCERRLKHLHGGHGFSIHTLCADALDPLAHKTLPDSPYDLVITNPPYVRYQAYSHRSDQVRQGLSEIADNRLSGCAYDIWRKLIKSYSGLADLSVPSWVLSALMVKPGGYLALIVPAAWRSREYADVIRYLLLRCFQLQLIVEDTQPGWFSDALVRTHLIIARRLSDDQITVPLGERSQWPEAQWVQVAPEASSADSLVGRAFPGEQPEAAFARWCSENKAKDVCGISARSFSLEEEWQAVRAQTDKRTWMRALESSVSDLPLFRQIKTEKALVPESLHNDVPRSFNGDILRPLSDTGISVGQGLRTGCNRFFYVRFLEELTDDLVRVVCDKSLGAHTFIVPSSALKPVLHRQADLEAWQAGKLPETNVLDLRCFILPEHQEIIFNDAKHHASKAPVPMPDELAAHVRTAGNKVVGNGKNAKPISMMSAVKTNVRSAKAGSLPRFWYMLPDFMPRHMPQAFVPRIIHDAPFVYGNTEPPTLIDANFSTFWERSGTWTASGITAFLNSAWCRTVMEASGTALGGGALKLEAVHLRRMPVPLLDSASIEKLNRARPGTDEADQIVLQALVGSEPSNKDISAFARRLNERRAILSSNRQKGVA